jgi:hypothetical protein
MSSDSPQRPKPIKKGPKWLRDGLKDRDDFAQANMPLQGHNILIDRLKEGSRINADGGSGDGGGTTNDFALYDASTDASVKIGVDNGYVENILPSGMVEGATRGSADAYTIAVSGSGVIVLKATINSDGVVTAVVIQWLTSVPANTSTTAYRVLGDFSVPDGALSIGAGKAGIGSQGVFSCGGNHYFYAA